MQTQQIESGGYPVTVWHPPTQFAEGYFACWNCAAPVHMIEVTNNPVPEYLREFLDDLAGGHVVQQYRVTPCGHRLRWYV